MLNFLLLLIVVIIVGPYIGHVLCAIASHYAEAPPHPECFNCNKGSCKGCIIKGGD